MGVYEPLIHKLVEEPSFLVRGRAWHGLSRTVAWTTMGLALVFCALNLLSSFTASDISNLQDSPCEGVGCERNPGRSVVLDVSEGTEDDATILSE